MKSSSCRIAILYLVCTHVSGGIAAAQTVSYVVGRMGMRNFGTYHLVEVLQQRGRWIAPDISYIDFGSNKYREFSIGGGADVYTSKRLIVTEEGYLTQATGPASQGACYFVPWTGIFFSLTPEIQTETAYFPYLPLNKSGRIQHIFERSKIEYLFQHFKIGVGYSGYQYADTGWHHKPFLTTTFRGGRLGEMEFWLQRLPGNHVQAQMRYVFKHKSHNR